MCGFGAWGIVKCTSLVKLSSLAKLYAFRVRDILKVAKRQGFRYILGHGGLIRFRVGC